MSTGTDELVTVAEAAAFLRVAPSTVRRWIRQGEVPAYRVGPRRVALKRGELTALVSPATVNRRDLTPDEHKQEKPRRLSPEEQQRGFAALERAERHAREIFGGAADRSLPSSVDIIHQMREERMRELTDRWQ